MGSQSLEPKNLLKVAVFSCDPISIHIYGPIGCQDAWVALGHRLVHAVAALPAGSLRCYIACIQLDF